MILLGRAAMHVSTFDLTTEANSRATSEVFGWLMPRAYDPISVEAYEQVTKETVEIFKGTVRPFHRATVDEADLD